MEIPPNILEELKCSSCPRYLSRGPVYVQPSGAAICGECSTTDTAAIRMKQYEATAKLLRFPCKYQEFGCLEKVPYAEEQEVIPHEEECDHRPYNCWCFDNCNFKHNNMTAMLAHCRERHPDSVFENSCNLVHDISTSNVHNYIITAFELIFLLKAKVCLTTKEICHSVCLLGTAAETTDYFFILEVRRNNKQLSDEGEVMLHDNLPMKMKINTLSDAMGGLEDAIFTVTIKRKMNNTAEQLVKRMSNLIIEGVKCECGRDVTIFRYCDHRGWRCQGCAPASRPCENLALGCVHSDIDKKCTKHERYFCHERVKCLVCDKAIQRRSLLTHYASGCSAEPLEARATWRATFAPYGRRCLTAGDAGIAICWYWLTDNDAAKLELWVLTSVLSERLSEYRCIVRVVDPATGQGRSYTPNLEYEKVRDWYILVRKDDFPSWSGEFDLKVDICRL